MEDNNTMTLPLEEADNNITESPVSSVEYTDDNIRHLDDMEHIRVRSGMYIGRLGDGSQNDDGIYVLLKDCLLYTSWTRPTRTSCPTTHTRQASTPARNTPAL